MNVQITGEVLLSQAYYKLTNVTFIVERNSTGEVQTMTRELYDKGDGVAVLPYDPQTGQVILVRQFRLPAYVRGDTPWQIEAVAGLFRPETDNMEQKAMEEAGEEAGVILNNLRHIFSAYASSATLTEKVHYFLGEYTRFGEQKWAGVIGEGEETEVLELPFEEAMDMVNNGVILDSRTILLLFYLKNSGLIVCGPCMLGYHCGRCRCCKL